MNGLIAIAWSSEQSEAKGRLAFKFLLAVGLGLLQHQTFIGVGQNKKARR